MAYRIYMTVEMLEAFDSKEAAMDAAVSTLQDAVEAYHQPGGEDSGICLNGQPLRPMQCRVFIEDTITHGVDHEFIVDIHDGAI